MAPPRTLHIRCGTWDQVEAFYSRKLRRGRLLSMRVPFSPPIGSDLSIGLELPSHEVITIDGAVRKCEPGEDSRHWIEIELVGLGEELLRRLRELVAEGVAAKARGPGDSDLTPVPVVPTTLEPTPTVLARPALPPQPAKDAPPPAPRPRAAPTSPPPLSAPSPLSASLSSASAAPSPPPLRTPLAPPVSEDTVPRSPRLEDGALRTPRITVPMEPVAEGEDLPGDERELFAALSSELRRLRQVAVHEVFGVSREANAEEIRAGWMAHIRRFHPDVMARHRSDAVSHLAEELTILGNRAYDRLRVALVAEGRGAAFGPALFTPHGWLVGFEDLSTSDVPAARVLASARPLTPAVPLVSGGGSPSAVAGTAASGRGSSSAGGASSASSSAAAGGGGSSGGASGGETGFEHLPSGAATRTGESFEAQARELLANGDSSGAREVLATALVVYPRSRPLRSLYYVASALTALAAGQVVLATSQLETALAHHEGCVEASLILDQIHRNGGRDHDMLRRLFQ